MYAPPLYVVRKFKFREIVVSQFDLHFDKKQEKKYAKALTNIKVNRRQIK